MARRTRVTYRSGIRKVTFYRREHVSDQKMFAMLFAAIFASAIGIEACYFGLAGIGHLETVKLAALAAIGIVAALSGVAICLYAWKILR